MSAPTWRKFVELLVSAGSISIDVPLKIAQADVHNNVYALQLRQALK